VHTRQTVSQEETQKLARCNIAIASCGALTFENSSYSACPSRNVFQKHVNYQGRNSTDYSLNYHKTKVCFQQEFDTHFPWLVQGRHTIMINCNHLRNPEHQEKLTNHIGLHPRTLLQTASHDELEDLLRDLKAVRQNPEQKWLIILVCRKGTHRSVAVSELIELLCDKYIYDDQEAVENHIAARDRQEDPQSENVVRFHLCQHTWSHTCGGYDDGYSQGNNRECEACQLRTPGPKADFREAMRIASKNAMIGIKGGGFLRIKDDGNETFLDEFSNDYSFSESEDDQARSRQNKQEASQASASTSGGFPALGQGKSTSKSKSKDGYRQPDTKGKGKAPNDPGWSVREVPASEVQHLQPGTPAALSPMQQMAADNARDRAAAKVKREAEEARQKTVQEQQAILKKEIVAEQEKKGKGQLRTARSPEPYRQRKPAQQYPDAPWSRAPQIGKGSKGSKAPQGPKSPPPAKELVTVKEDTFTPVARPSKTRLELRRQLPKHLVEGKGQAAASSSVTAPVHNQTAALAKSKIIGTYADPVIQAVLRKLTFVFEPRTVSTETDWHVDPLDQIADMVLKHNVEWDSVGAMFECALEEKNAPGRSDQSVSSRGRSEKRQGRQSKSSREKRSSSSDDHGTASKYQGRSRSRKEKRERKVKEEPASSSSDAEPSVDYGGDDEDEAKGNTDTRWVCSNCGETRLKRNEDYKCRVCETTQEDSDKAWVVLKKQVANVEQKDEQESVSDGITDLMSSKRVSEQALAARKWKYEFDPANLNANELDLIYDEQEANGKHKNHRTYIGPDSYGVGEDKIPVEVKYANQDKKVTYNGMISHYQKTTFCQ
jgi:rubrerythrin